MKCPVDDCGREASYLINQVKMIPSKKCDVKYAVAMCSSHFAEFFEEEDPNE